MQGRTQVQFPLGNEQIRDAEAAGLDALAQADDKVSTGGRLSSVVMPTGRCTCTCPRIPHSPCSSFHSILPGRKPEHACLENPTHDKIKMVDILAQITTIHIYIEVSKDNNSSRFVTVPQQVGQPSIPSRTKRKKRNRKTNQS